MLLPHWPFQAMVETDVPRPRPAWRRGVTFAYSGRTERLNHRTFRVWGEILRRVPGARLVLDFRSFGDARSRAHFGADGALRAGPGARGDAQQPRHLRACTTSTSCSTASRSGGTMLVALWMGVPA